MNYIYDVAKHTHSNSKYSNFQQDITSDYVWVFASTGKYFFTIDTDEYYQMYYKVNDTKTFENLVGLFMLYAHKSIITYVYCRLGSLNCGL